MQRKHVVEIDGEIVKNQNYWLDIIRKLNMQDKELMWTAPDHCYRYSTEKSLNEQYQYTLTMHYLETEE